mmetsp:Transcript_15119/g.38350  ORF Transcript_15119/g.38350 Transcript_15119/m.38350 type:complete len:267 (-) Transcript_15119:33-833(-)
MEYPILHPNFRPVVDELTGPAPLHCMDVGCGTGATAFPLQRLNPNWTWTFFDVSSTAVECLKAHELYDPKTSQAFPFDMTSEEPFPKHVKPHSVDLALLIFVLSAIHPDKMVPALQRVRQCMKPGGAVIFRDYGLYDLTHVRFIKKGRRKLGDNFYARFDGTRCQFFSLESLESIFREAGFVVEELDYVVRELRNRKTKLVMHRVWIKAIFRVPPWHPVELPHPHLPHLNVMRIRGPSTDPMPTSLDDPRVVRHSSERKRAKFNEE